MKMSKFIKSTLILLVGGFLTKVLGMLIKIITTRIIGTETLGLYMLIMPTFNLFITLAQGGLPISVSKIVSENKKDNSIFLNLKDGICLLKDYISFLEGDLKKILQENTKTLLKIKKIRNKYEHEPHNVNGAFSTGHSSFSAMGFYCRNELVSIDTMELTYIIYDIMRIKVS